MDPKTYTVYSKAQVDAPPKPELEEEEAAEEEAEDEEDPLVPFRVKDKVCSANHI